MSANQTARMYRRTVAQTATSVELVILLYDMLVADLRLVIEAMQKGDIERRATQIKHALRVLEQLQGSLDMDEGGEAAKRLARFYSHVRCKILESHAKISVPLLDRQIDLLLDVRSAWEQVKNPGSTAVAVERTAPANRASAVSSSEQEEGHVSSSWSA